MIARSNANPASTSQRRRMWLRWLGALALLGVTLWLGMSYSVAYELTRRSRPRCQEPLPDLTWGAWESTTLQTSDGETLGAWFCDGRMDRPIVILLHGNGGCRTGLLAQAEWLVHQGYGVLLVTLRAHGDSTGEYNDAGYSARHDVVTAVQWLKSQAAGRHIVIWGQSLGGAAAVMAAEANQADVDGYILECVYSDLKTAVHNRLELSLPSGLIGVAYTGLWLVSPWTAPYLTETAPVVAAGKIPKGIPVLLLAGGEDRRAEVSESEAIAQRIGTNAEVVVFPTSGHLALLTTDRGRYFAAVSQLLSRVNGDQ
jgi:uncharacterized protein